MHGLIQLLSVVLRMSLLTKQALDAFFGFFYLARCAATNI
jgi:hypothetical protein